MRISQKLVERPFNVKDGDRYIILVNVNNTNYVYAGKNITKEYKASLLSKTFNQAKVFHSIKIAQKTAYNNLIEHDYRDWSIIKVKDLFEPRYRIKYIKKHIFIDAYIDISLNWYVIGDQIDHTYLTYPEALVALNKCKMELVEEYYKMITAVRDLKLPEIENGTP
jgi:hypothetical protein